MPVVMRIASWSTCLFAAAVAIGCGGDDDDDEPVQPTVDPTTSVQEIAEDALEAESPEGLECADDAPTVGYLPWLAPGDAVPPPQESSGPNEDAFFRSWHAPGELGDDGSDPGFVLITVDTSDFTNTGGGPGRPIGVVIGGDEGEFHEAPTENSGFVQWETDAETCDLIGLTIGGPESWTRADTEREIIRVAESLH